MIDENWCLSIIRQELADGWSIIYAADGYCWFDSKQIQLPYDNATESIFLHELAHALYHEPERYGEGLHYHGGVWASVFGKLVDKYMQPVKLTGLRQQVDSIIERLEL